MLSLKAAPPQAWTPGSLARWMSPVSVPRHWAAAAFGVCAAFAGGVALFSTNDLHRLWGLIATCAYVAAALAVLAWRSRGIDLALLLSVGGALVTPMFWNAATGQHQPEVSVIARSAKQLVHHHSPYQTAAALAAAHDPNAYNPYLPVMSIFGIPRALFGTHIDHRSPGLVRARVPGHLLACAEGRRGEELHPLDGVHRGVARDRVRARRRRRRHPDPGPDVPWLRAAVAAPQVRAGRDRARPGVGGEVHGLAGRDRRRGADRHA